jgi:hypothetical protein
MVEDAVASLPFHWNLLAMFDKKDVSCLKVEVMITDREFGTEWAVSHFTFLALNSICYSHRQEYEVWCHHA